MKKKIIYLFLVTNICALNAKQPSKVSVLTGSLLQHSSSGRRSVGQISSIDDFNRQLQAKPFAIVKFSINKCPSCKKTKPTFDALSNQYSHISFIEVNYSTPYGKSLAGQFGVGVFPTFIFFKNGQKTSITHKAQRKDRIVGGTRKDLEKQLQTLK